jgi:molybdate transport system substrate-binding protein
MRSICLAIGILAFASSFSQAAELRIMNTGVVNPPGLRNVTDAFTKKSGVKVTIVNTDAPSALRDFGTVTPAADLIILPVQQMGDLDFQGGIKPNHFAPLGRIGIGLWAKAGAPHPDISTLPKLVAVLKSASVVMYNDPVSGSIPDQYIDTLLRQPEFAGVKTMKTTGDAVAGLIRRGAGDQNAVALGLVHAVHPGDGEGPKDAPELVGPLSADLKPYVDMMIAISPRTTDEKDAAALISFMNQPDMIPIWKQRGMYPY